MPQLTVATFNVENLLSTLPSVGDDSAPRWEGPLRYLKRDRMADPAAVLAAFQVMGAHEKAKLTALAMAALDADVICLQEVESEPVLRQFRNEYLDPLTGGAYRFLKLAEGNDSRGIDVAILSRIHLDGMRHHNDIRYEDVPGAWTDALARTVDRYRAATSDNARLRYPKPDDFVFRRGLLTVDVTVGTSTVTIATVHLKSIATSLQPSFAPDRDYTAPLRRAEALAVRHVLEQRFGASLPHALYVVGGDFNDYPWRNGVATDPQDLSIAPLHDPAFATSALADLPPHERWTHWWPEENAFAQLDDLLISPALRRANPVLHPTIERRGLPWRMPWRPAQVAVQGGWVPGPLDPAGALAFALHGLDRFPGVGWDAPRASDHAPVAVTLTIPEREA